MSLIESFGDVTQLYPHRHPDLRRFPKYNSCSLAFHLLSHAQPLTINMFQVYRSHPAIVEAFSFAAYDNQLKTTILLPDRTKLTQSLFPLIRQQYPIVLCDLRGQCVKLPTKSRRNVTQCTFVINLVKHLGRLAKKLKVTVTTYYSGDYRYIKQKLQSELHGSTTLFDLQLLQSLDVSTVNAFIGGETDVQILVTGVDVLLSSAPMVNQMNST